MGLTAEEREQFRAQLDDLVKRAAETDKRIEEHNREIALLIERIQHMRRRLLRYC
jgi:hypothetical protein